MNGKTSSYAEPLFRDRLATDGDAFPNVVQVRGGEASDIQPVCREQPPDEARGRGLAVGASDVNGWERPLWVAEQVHDGRDPAQVGLQLVLRSAGQNGLFDLAHALAEGQAVGSVTLGSVGGGTHRPSLSARGRCPRAIRSRKGQVTGVRKVSTDSGSLISGTSLPLKSSPAGLPICASKAAWSA